MKNKVGLSTKYAVTAILMAGILWGMIGLFVRKLTEMGFNSMDVTALRSVAALFLMAGYLLIYKKELMRIKWRDIWCFLGTGVFSLTFFNVCYFKTIQITSLSVAAILLYTAPSIVMLLSALLFHEKITKKKLFSLLLAFFGCILVTGLLREEMVLSPLGILTGLGAGAGYALYSIFSRYAIERHYHSLTITFYTFLLSGIGIQPFVDAPRLVNKMVETPEAILFIAALGLCSTVLPYILYTYGLTKVENGKASIMASIEPVAATLLGVFYFKEEMSVDGLLGVMLVLTSIILLNINWEHENNS